MKIIKHRDTVNILYKLQGQSLCVFLKQMKEIIDTLLLLEFTVVSVLLLNKYKRKIIKVNSYS